MLHILFGEPEKVPDGALGETLSLMDRFSGIIGKRLAEGREGDGGAKLRKYHIWTRGLRASLIELDQSYYASVKFREKVASTSVEAMSPEEKLDYDRYVYFDKNAFIRVFSLLDKLGTLLNELLGLRTERFKPHFSYFTVLRHMREKRAHTNLGRPLDEIKERYSEPMRRLRKRRNTEIHYMNSEMQDDLIQSQRMYGEEIRLENIQAQEEDLQQSLNMAIESLRLTFQYACGLIKG